MKLQRREIVTIALGLTVVLAAWVIRARPFSGAASADSLSGLLTTARNFSSLQDRVKLAAERLHIDVPEVEPSEQEVRLRETLSRQAQSNGMQLGALKRFESGSRVATTQTALDFQLEVNGQFDQLVRFINALEGDKHPFQVSELRVEAGRSGGGGMPPGGGGGMPPGGGGARYDGNIRCTMKVRGYVFPQVFLTEKKSAAPPAAEGPMPGAVMMPPQDAPPPPMAGPQATTSPEAGKTQQQTPAPATPPPANSGGGGRKEFSYGASKVVYEGGKFSLNGMEIITLTPDRMNKMSDEDIRKMAEQLAAPEPAPVGAPEMAPDGAPEMAPAGEPVMVPFGEPEMVPAN